MFVVLKQVYYMILYKSKGFLCERFNFCNEYNMKVKTCQWNIKDASTVYLRWRVKVFIFAFVFSFF